MQHKDSAGPLIACAWIIVLGQIILLYVVDKPLTRAYELFFTVAAAICFTNWMLGRKYKEFILHLYSHVIKDGQVTIRGWGKDSTIDQCNGGRTNG
jgi:hypothetical protein